MSRAISTVADVVVCLLLVSAAVFVVTTPAEPPADLPADDTAQVLATSTAAVEYEFGTGNATRTHRTRGTYAGLLGRAALLDATYGGEPVAPGSEGFVTGVRERTRSVLGANVQVSVRWAPYPGTPVAGRVSVGPDPPPAADLHVARLTVPVGVPPSDPSRTYRTVANGVADVVTRGLLPEETAGLPLGTGPYRRAVDHRLGVLAGDRHRAARAYAARGNATAARQVAARALAGVFARDLRSRFDSPRAAARAVRAGMATVVVRRWAG